MQPKTNGAPISGYMIRGHVRYPGVFALDQSNRTITLREAIQAAGGFDEPDFASEAQVELNRESRPLEPGEWPQQTFYKWSELQNANRDPILQPGDFIEVKSGKQPQILRTTVPRPDKPRTRAILPTRADTPTRGISAVNSDSPPRGELCGVSGVLLWYRPTLRASLGRGAEVVATYGAMESFNVRHSSAPETRLYAVTYNRKKQ